MRPSVDVLLIYGLGHIGLTWVRTIYGGMVEWQVVVTGWYRSMDSVTGTVTPRGHTWSATGRTLLDIRGDSLSIAENVYEEKAKAMEGNECEQEKQ